MDNLSSSLIRELCRLHDTAVELGGTVYDVAAESGLWYAFEYLEKYMNPDGSSQPAELTTVTEGYVQWDGTEEKERVFLRASDVENEEELYKKGKIQSGRLMIPPKTLQKLVEEGYTCMYNRREEGFKFWTNNYTFLGDGHNRAVYVKTPMEDTLVMPDLFAVKQAVRTYEAECLIRRNVAPRFFVERIDERNEAVLFHQEELIAEIFPENWLTGFQEGQLPDSYRKLVYQVCYIRYFYKDIYRKVWDESREPGDMFPPAFEPGCIPKTLGIALGPEESYAVYVDAAGKMGYIPAHTDEMLPANRSCCFRGSGDLRHAGIAYSETALLFKSILQNQKMVFDAPVEQVNVIYTGDAPGRVEIARAMWERGKTQDPTGKNTPELVADMQLEGKLLNGIGIIREAGALVGLPKYQATALVIEAAAKAYDARKAYRLAERECALVLYLDNTDLRVGFAKKENGEIEQAAWKESKEWKRLIKKSDERLKEKMKETVAADLKEIGVWEHEATPEALKTLCGDIDRVKRQFLRCDEAAVRFDNGWLTITKDMPIAAYQECTAPLYQELGRTVEELLKERSGYSFSKIYLAGIRSGDPGLWEYLKKQYPAKVCILSDPEYVVALGAAMERPEESMEQPKNNQIIKEEKSMGRPKIELWQGLARYADSADLETCVPPEGKTLEMKTIEDWKIERIPQFTLALPGAKDKMAMCRRTKDVSGLQKVADIYREQKKTKIRFYKICENYHELVCDGTPIGYLAVTNQKGVITTYEFALEPVPMMKDPEGAIAFVDGSGGGKKSVSGNGVTYNLYGGAYLLYKPGDSEPFFSSETDEEEPIRDGLMGITTSVGNVYGEINSAMMAIRKADHLGYRNLRVYYDCEQIGGHAPGGAFNKHDTAISRKYAEFLAAYEFESLQTIELVHVDGHVGVQPNEKVDQAAKRVRDAVAKEFETDPEKRALYLAHAEDYKN